MMTLRDMKNSLSNQERLDSIVDCINTLICLGLEPTGFEMDADLLAQLVNYSRRKDLIVADENGIVNLCETMEKYTYSILDIPINPLYGIRNTIEVKRKED